MFDLDIDIVDLTVRLLGTRELAARAQEGGSVVRKKLRKVSTWFATPFQPGNLHECWRIRNLEGRSWREWRLGRECWWNVTGRQ